MWFRLAVLAGLVAGLLAACPHENENLKSFSTLFTDYEKSSDLVITEETLLDVTLLDINTVTISGSGKLVFNQGHDITINTKGIRVIEDGALIIGSEDCRHEDKVNIFLEGSRTKDRDSVKDDGDKFITVTGNGVLQIHGEDKISWTKLTSTVDRYQTEPSKIKYVHTQTPPIGYNPSWMVVSMYVLNPDLTVASFKSHNLNGKNIKRNTIERDGMINKINDSADGSVIAIIVQNSFRVSPDLDVSGLFGTIETAAGMAEGELQLGTTKDDAYALVFAKGGDYAQTLGDMSGYFERTVSASISQAGYKVTAVSKVHRNRKQSAIDLRVMEESIGYPQITVLDDVSSWQVGDEVLLTSTDFAWNHGEVRKIQEKVDAYTLKLSEELEYRHFGEIEDGVDMRGEVALVSRNIKIQGKMNRGCPRINRNCGRRGIMHDTVGGHIKIYNSFGSVFIEGAQLSNMGQGPDMGHYPVHFHMCQDITGKQAIVKRNAIRNTYARATTIHGTWGTSEAQPGVQILENVAYDISGHAYFTEDGAEAATIFIGNLGAHIKSVHNPSFQTDRPKPTAFWITNPKVIMVNNVAAGSFGVGIWYTFPELALGPSKDMVFKFREAPQTQLWRSDNNVVHSCDRGGFVFDNILIEGGKVAACMRYEAFLDPLDPASGDVKSQITRLTAYKNRELNLWLRGGWIELMQLSSAESAKGVQIARGSPQQMFVKKSIFLGKTSNTEAADYPDAITGADLTQYIGVVFHDGPTYIETSWFNGFLSDDTDAYVAAAIGFVPDKKTSSSIVSNTTDLRFGFTDGVDGYRVFNGDLDGEVLGLGDTFQAVETATFRDADGSVSKCPEDDAFKGPVQLVAPQAIALTDRCTYNAGWDMAVCKDIYGKLFVFSKKFWPGSTFETFDRAGQMRRISYSGEEPVVYETHPDEPIPEYMIILGSDVYYYEYQFLNDFPQMFRLQGRGVEKDAHVVVGLCLPEGTTTDDFKAVNVMTKGEGEKNLDYVDNIQDVLDDTTMSKVYMNGRMLYTKIWTNYSRDPDWSKGDSDHCPGKYCARLYMEFNKQREYTPCFTAPEEDSEEDILEDIPRQECTLPSSQPEADWGVGDTRASHDGNWGEWTGWTECCGGNTTPAQRSRYRLCDNPPKYGTGADCPGESEELGESCPIAC